MCPWFNLIVFNLPATSKIEGTKYDTNEANRLKKCQLWPAWLSVFLLLHKVLFLNMGNFPGSGIRNKQVSDIESGYPDIESGYPDIRI